MATFFYPDGETFEKPEITRIYEFTVKDLPDAVYWVDKDGKFVFVNPAASLMYGYSEDEFSAINVCDLASCSIEKWAEEFLTLKEAGSTTRETEQKSKSGSSIPVEVKSSYFELNGVGYACNVAKDLSSRIRAIQLNSERLAAINSTKDKFFSMISHDLRSPFHILLNFSQMLLEDADKLSREQIKHYADTLYKSISNLYGLLENLLNWSLVQRDKISFEPQELNLTFVIDQAFEIVSTTALKKEIVLVNGVLQDTLVFADKNMLTTIIQNLVSNGIKFSHRGGSILVTAVKSEDELVLIVSDKGVGIKESDLQALFEQNGNLQTSGTEREKGSGLGLALCREFAKRHGGSLEVISHPGEGSRFFVSFPVSKNGNGI